MKKLILYFALILFTSCHTASYVHELESTPYGVNYSEGKWLLNEISSPESIKEKLNKIAYNGFYKKLGDKLKKSESLTNVSLPYLPIKPNKLLLEQIKKETKFDYLVNIRCKSTKDEIGGLKIGETYSKKRNVAVTILEIYDLNTLEVIYSRKVIGQVTIDDKDNEDFAFVKSTNGIIVSSLKKIMNKIN